MIATRRPLVALVLLAAACRSERAPASHGSGDSAHAPTASASPPAGALCVAPAGGLRFTLDSVAGIPAGLPIAELRRYCASARVDSVVSAGFAQPALRFDFPGGTVWAVQNEADIDTLVPARPAEYWAGVGDSLRFPDGRLIPRRLGALRAIDSAGVMFIESGDNTEGADVSLCNAPGLTFFFDTLPAPADTTVRPLSQLGTTDTTAYRLVAQHRDSVVLGAERRLCRRVKVR